MIWKSVRSMAAGVACTSLVLSGCITTQEGRIGSDDGSDMCRQYVVALDATGNFFAEDMVKGALAGAVAGGLLGAMLGGKNAAAAALMGAAAGAVAGAAGGYIKSKMDQTRDKAALYGSVMSDYDRDLAKIDEADLAFKKLVECRNRTMRQVASDYTAKSISRVEASSRWKRILDQKANDLRIAESMGKNMSKRLSEFESASAQISQNPWDAEAEAKFAREQQQLAAKQDQEQFALQKQQRDEEEALSSQRIQKAQKVAAEQEMKAKYARLKKQQEAHRSEESLALQQKKAGKIPTSTAQVHIQSFRNNVAVATDQHNKQLATADNPEGFENALSGGSLSRLVPAGGVIQLGWQTMTVSRQLV